MKRYLVIGNPIDHSLSPLLHNYWIEKNKITNVEFDFKEYDPFFNINTLDDLEAAKKIIKNEKK